MSGHGYGTAVTFKAVLFDLDGTLLHTLPDIADALNGVLAAHGLPVHGEDDYRSMVGWGIAHVAELAVPTDRRGEVSVAEIGAEMERAYRAHPLSDSRPFDGVAELVEALRETGVPLAVLSNKLHELTVRLVHNTWGEETFTSIHGAKDGVPRKPDPTAARLIASELGVEPHEMLFVGDTAIDMETAQVAGMIPVGVSWGYRDVEELWMHGAATVVSTPAEIRALVAGEAEKTE